MPEALSLPDVPRVVVGLLATTERSPLPVSYKVKAFACGAVEDAMRRCQFHYPPVTMCKADMLSTTCDGWPAKLLAIAKEHEVTCLVTAYAPVGPVATQLRSAKQYLNDAGIDLVQIRRPYDERVWPHATKGFFRLRKKIPSLIKC